MLPPSPEPSPLSRLFVAAPLPAATRAELEHRLPRPDEPGVRWVPPHQWHVTLRFLGEVGEAAAVAAVSTLVAPRATAALGPRVSRLGRDVVCLPVTGLDELAAAVLDATADLGRPDGRPFVGHVTLARLRHRAACGLTGTPVDLIVPVDEIVLVRSTLTPDGAVHEPVLTVPLG